MKNKSMRTGIVLLLVVAGMVSCKKDDYAARELESIQSYLKANGIVAEPTESGMYVIELISGTGDKPVYADTVEVWYTGKFLDGSIFDSNTTGNVFRFPVGEGYVIAGWDEGITHIREGGEALFIIPSALAYGSVGTYGIPGYTPLIFEVKLDRLYPGPAHLSR
jgi:FKBP-type peptidyl-prolyl cis-trans isomerase